MNRQEQIRATIENAEKQMQRLQELIDSLNTVEVKQEGRAEKGEIYWYINNSGAISSEIESGSLLDNRRFDTGNYYLSKKEMVKAEKKVLLFRLLDRFSRQNGWADEIWEDDEECKYYIFFDYVCNQIRIGDGYCTANSTGVYFVSESVAQQAIKKYSKLIMEAMSI